MACTTYNRSTGVCQQTVEISGFVTQQGAGSQVCVTGVCEWCVAERTPRHHTNVTASGFLNMSRDRASFLIVFQRSVRWDNDANSAADLRL
eukprot:m.119624 g.119624  ORF g.119624 m.119624 type:complete len:91 (+) comp16478_c0_seq5:2609-2881(+)